jgi:putative oxidoreductase
MESANLTETKSLKDICCICLVRPWYERLIKAASMLKPPLLLALRLYWGWQFFETGKGKLMNHEKVTQFFGSLHIPLPSMNAYLAGATECFGGLLLLIGLGSRLVCLPLIFVLIIAYATAETESVKAIFSDPDKFVTATPFLFLEACVVVLVFGPGKFSVDALLAGKFSSKDNAPTK